MSVFGKLKKMAHHGDDLDDFRSHVTNDYPSPAPEKPFEPQRREEKLHTIEWEPPKFSEPLFEKKEPELKEFQRRDYDIIDKLNMIEAQISAIRSQTETINERLKNIEARFARRY